MKAAYAVVAIFLAMAFVGCPAVQTPVPGTDDGGVTAPDMAKVIVKGQLYDPDAKASVREIGDLLKRQIRVINLYFYLIGDERLEKNQTINIPVENGSYESEFLIRPGEYDLWVEAVDGFGQILFTDQSGFKVMPGENHLPIKLEMISSYRFRFVIDGLPGEYNETGGATITTNKGECFGAWYGPLYLRGAEQPLPMVFDVYMPLDFNGAEDQAVMTVVDKNGKSHAAALSFNVFDAAVVEVMHLPYTYPDWMGTVDVDITFGYEDESYIYAGGQSWNSIQQAVDALPSPIEIQLGAGDFDGFTSMQYKSIAIVGQGVGKTRIVDNDVSNPRVITVTPWLAKGGGVEGVIRLANVAIVNGPGKACESYADAAVFIETGALAMYNCVVVSSNSGVATNYDHAVDINHCVFLGCKSPDAMAVATYNEQYVTITNCIFADWSKALFNSNGSLEFQYDLFWNCALPISDGTGGGAVYRIEGMLWQEDPKLIDGYHLGEGSAAIGKANDGLDMGIVF